jgi:transaldolase
VVDVLEKEGVEKFEASWSELVANVKQELGAAKSAR